MLDTPYMVLFLLGVFFTVTFWVCSFVILRKMGLDGFGISDLWNPTGELYRRYVQEAKRRDWSLLPVYIPAVVGAIFVGYFVIELVKLLRNLP